jgi:hypothetical protein
VLVSAATGEGVEELAARIAQEFRRTLRPVELLLPYAEGGRLAELHDVAGDLEREETPEGVRIRARLPVTVAERFAPFAVDRPGGEDVDGPEGDGRVPGDGPEGDGRVPGDGPEGDGRAPVEGAEADGRAPGDGDGDAPVAAAVLREEPAVAAPHAPA